jgi:hypothetical protein
VLHPSDLRTPAGDAALGVFVERAARAAVTCLAGPAERLVPFLDRVKQVRGTDRLREIWPGLGAVLTTRRPGDLAGGRLRAEVGEGVLVLETAFRPEGPVAVEDPRHGALRLLPDHGVYFEFVPAGEAGQPRPTRHTLAEVEMGVPYELALTSPAGLWACRVGLTVRFEKRDPPLLRLDGAAVGQTSPVRLDAPAPTFPAQGPHRQSDGSPAGLRESFAHSPWSTPWGRE